MNNIQLQNRLTPSSNNNASQIQQLIQNIMSRTEVCVFYDHTCHCSNSLCPGYGNNVSYINSKA